MLKLKKRRSVGLVVANIFVYCIAAIFIFPFLLSILVSLKSPMETAQNLLALPEVFHFENYTEAMQKAKILQSFLNSVFVTVLSVLTVVIFTSMSGYGIGRYYRKKTMRLYEMLLLASMMIPFQTVMIPLYKLLKYTDLMSTRIGVVIIISGTSLAFATMMYIGFVKTLPIELEEAAYIEGYKSITIFFKIVLPLLKPITFTVATLHALWIWNEFSISLIVLQRDAVKTIPMQQHVFFSQYSSNYNLAFAAAVISMIPVVVFFVLAQKHIVQGLVEGAVKG